MKMNRPVIIKYMYVSDHHHHHHYLTFIDSIDYARHHSKFFT